MHKPFQKIEEFYPVNIILILKSCKHIKKEERKTNKPTSLMNLDAKILNKC